MSLLLIKLYKTTVFFVSSCKIEGEFHVEISSIDGKVFDSVMFEVSYE